MKNKYLLFLFTIISFTSTLFAQTYRGHFLKEVKSNINCCGHITFTCAAYDKQGNLYAAGNFNDSITFNNGIVLVSDTSVDGSYLTNIVFAKFDRKGHAVWAKKAGSNIGGVDETAYNIAIDNNNNIYSTGYCNAGAMFDNISLSNIALGSGGGYGGFLAKLDTNGNYKWVKDGVMASPKALCIDKNNNVFVGGEWGFTTGAASPQFMGTIFPYVYNDKSFLFKVDGNGVVLNTFYSVERTNISSYLVGGIDLINEVAVDELGNIIVTGEYAAGGFVIDSAGSGSGAGSGPSGSADTKIKDANGTYWTPGSNAAYVMKLNNNLKFQWAKPNWSSAENGYTGSGFNAIAIDSLNNIYVGGYFGDTVKIGINTFTQKNYRSLLYAKFSASGNFQWAKTGDNNGFGNNHQFNRLKYDRTSDKIWVSIRNGIVNTISARNAISIGGFRDSSSIIIANINISNGSFTSLISCPTDAELYGEGLAVWNKKITVAGSFYPRYSIDTVMNLLGYKLPLDANGRPKAYLFEFADSIYALDSFMIVAPANNLRIVSSSTNNSPLVIKWRDSYNANQYRCILDTLTGLFKSGFYSQLSKNYGSADTTISISLSVIDDVLDALNIKAGDSIKVKLTVRAYGTNNDSLLATNFINLTFIKGNTTGLKATLLANCSIKIYPNPAHGTVVFENTNSTIISANAYSIQGVKNYLSIHQNELDISSLHTGIYFVELADENGNIFRTKLIVQ
jgi:hypothetical protein